jgi:conjugal transfer pilus assembly protein TraE
MNLSVYQSEIKKMIEQRNGYLVLSTGLLLLCLLLAGIDMCLLSHEKVVIIPPSIEKSFWVSAQRVSPEYLSEMTVFFTNLRFNMTPESAASQRDTLLRYTDPTFYNALKTQLIQEADRITEQHITMAFFPVNIKVDSSHFKAVIEGDIKAFIGDTVLPTQRVKYVLTYRYDAGRLLVNSFAVVKVEDPHHA